MVKDRSIAKGGWFYANPAAPKIDTTGKTPAQIEKAIDAAVEQVLDNYDYPFPFPASGVALGTCQRCHASAANEMTFSSLDNVLGFPGQPIRFLNDDTWRNPDLLSVLPRKLTSLFAAGGRAPHTDGSRQLPSASALTRPMRARTDLGDNLELQRVRHVGPPPAADTAADEDPGRAGAGGARAGPDVRRHLPPGITDEGSQDVPGPVGRPRRRRAERSGSVHHLRQLHGLPRRPRRRPYGMTMFVKTGTAYGDGFNLSEFGEWRWSPMGLAGRDPIFHAQVESELALLDAEFPPDKARAAKTALLNLCLSCHGAMGQRQLALDAQAGHASAITGKPLDPNFKLEYFDLTTALDAKGLKQKDYEYHKYGNLAREGVSCTICHHIDPPDPAKVKASGFTDIEYFLMKNTTGRYERGPDNILNGPFDKVAVLPMQASLGITPKFNPYLKDSRVCGTCHAINLPNVDAPFPGKFPYLNEAETIPEFQKFPHSIEQATFLEWQNSVFANQADAKEFKSCQDCHMPGSFVSADKRINLPQLVTQIATIEDTNYPMVDHGAPADAIHVPVRGNYKRHELVGLNVFIESMFNQFDPILGVAQSDFMTSATNGNIVAMDNMVRQAREATVDLAVKWVDTPDNAPLVAEVIVTNKVGHRFPSGVGFRRAFLEVLARKKSTGEVVWGSGRTSSVGVIVDGQGRPLPSEFLPDAKTFQPHYQEIRAEDQVQIYEELTLNAKNEFTTSFIHRDSHPKDNRLLARGWLSGDHLATKSPIVKQFLVATDPEGASVLADPDFSDNGGKGATGIDHINYVMSLPAGVEKADIAVKVTMYYQAIPPFYLQQRFQDRAQRRGHQAALLHGQPAGDGGDVHRRLEAPARLRDDRRHPEAHAPHRGCCLARRIAGTTRAIDGCPVPAARRSTPRTRRKTLARRDSASEVVASACRPGDQRNSP